MLRKHSPSCSTTTRRCAARAEELAARCHELVSFLVDVMGVQRGRARRADASPPPTTTAAPACASSRSSASRARSSPASRAWSSSRWRTARSAAASAAPSASSIPRSRPRWWPTRRPTIEATGAELAAGRRSGLPDEHGRPAQAPGLARAGAARRRGAGGRPAPRPRSAEPALSRERGHGSRPRSRSRTTPRARSPTRRCRRRSAKIKAGWVAGRRPRRRAAARVRGAARPGRGIKDHTLAHLDLYLEAFEAKVRERGGKVHWARDAAEARAIVLELCRAAGARTVTKSKSMIAEEIGLNALPRGERHRSRSRPISASTSSSSPASRRATWSARRST